MSNAIESTLGALGERLQAGARQRSKFYFGMAVAMSVVIFIGFGPTFYLNPWLGEPLGAPPLATMPRVIVVHGLVLTAWMAVLMLQTGLVAGGHTLQHRRLGVVGAVLAAAVFVLGMTAQIASTRRDVLSGAYDANPFIRLVVLAGFVSILVFGLLAGLAILWRRRPDSHRRLMLLATIAIVGAGAGRMGRIIEVAMPSLGPLPWLGLALTNVFIVALVVHDWRAARRVHPATLCGSLAVLAMQAVNFTPLPHSAAMQQLARWLAS
jgi:FtsH-binding integral membrane protein